MKVATEMVDKRVPVILGCSSPSPREVIELAEYSAKVGGDLVQVLMPLRPWGGQPTIAELMEFYTQVASASPLPVTCYHNPGRVPTPSGCLRQNQRNRQYSLLQGKLTRYYENIQIN